MDEIQIKNYIIKYKDQYSRESLETQLKKSGVTQEEINLVYSRLNLNSISKEKIQTNFSGFIKNSLDLYFSNRNEAFNYIKDIEFGKAFIYYILILSFFNFFLYYLNPKQNLLSFNIFPVLFFIFIYLLLYLFGYLLVIQGIFYFLIKLFGGKGNFIDTIKYNISISIFPIIIGFIFNIILFFISTKIDMMFYLLIKLLSLFLIYFIIISIGIISIQSRVHLISKLKVFLIILVPILLVLGLVLGAVFSSFSNFASVGPNKLDLSNNLRGNPSESNLNLMQDKAYIVFNYIGSKSVFINSSNLKLISNSGFICDLNSGIIKINNLDSGLSSNLKSKNIPFLNGESGSILFTCPHGSLNSGEVFEGRVIIPLTSPVTGLNLISSGLVRLKIN